MLQSIGMVVVALGIIGIIWGIFQKVKAGRVADAPLVATRDAATRGSEVASPKGALSAQGRVVCQQPLLSPVTGTPCLYYHLKCTMTWKDGNVEKSKEIDHQQQAATFAIDDGSGPVYVDAREGGDFEPSLVKEETKGAGLLGGITGKDIMFGNYRVAGGILSMGTKYRVREEVLPVQPNLYICGKTVQGAIAKPGWRQLIISNKSRDQLLASATKGAKVSLIVGAAAFVGGGALATIAQIFAPADLPAPAPAQLTAASAATPASAEPPPAPAPTHAASASATATQTASPKPAPRPSAKPTKK